MNFLWKLFGGKPTFRKRLRTQGFDCEIVVNLTPFARRVDAAQTYLDTQILADCSQFIPFRTGTLRGSGRILKNPDGGSTIEWNTPYAHYQYEGIVYENPVHHASGFIGSDGMWHGWKGPKVPTTRALHYYQPGTGDHWIDRAQEAYGASWMNGVKRVIRGR